MTRFVLHTIVTIALTATTGLTAPPVAASLDPEVNEAYRWQVVLRAKPHPLLTPTFREQILRDVKAALQSHVGSFGTVETIDLAAVAPEKRDPLWAAFDKDGWPALTAEPARILTGVKTHFLTLEVKDGVFQLEARQLDGSTGLASPLVRKRSERSADRVGRQAGIILSLDFGPVGTLVSGEESDPNGVIVRIRGSALGPGRFVKPGDLFAVSGIRKVDPPTVAKDRQRGSKPAALPPAAPPKLVGTPREFTFLRVTVVSANGDCRCAVISRFEKGLPSHFAGVVGVRCLKLPTVEAPVQIRLVGSDGQAHPRAAAVSVKGGDAGYAVNPGDDSGFTFQNGTFRSPRPLSNIACLSVSLSPTWEERFPVPVYGDGPVTLSFEFDEKKAKQAELDRACLTLWGRVAEAHNATTTLYTSLIGLVKTGNNREALVRVKDGVTVATATEKSLTAELEALRKRPGANAGYAGTQLKNCEDQIKAFRDVIAQLNGNVAGLEEKAKLDPVKLEKEFRANDLRDLINRQIEIGEVPEALEIYDELIKLTNDENQKIAKENLLKEWAAKTDDHRIAREVILKTWPDAQSIEDYETAVKKLASAIRECMKQKDRLGLRKLMNTFNPAYAKLEGLAQGLDASIKADEERLKAIQKVSQDAREIEQQVRDWLKQNLK